MQPPCYILSDKKNYLYHDMYHNETKCTHEILLLFGRQCVIFRTSLNNQLKTIIYMV